MRQSIKFTPSPLFIWDKNIYVVINSSLYYAVEYLNDFAQQLIAIAIDNRVGYIV